MRVAISLRLASEDWEQASAYVVEAERMGVDCLWSAEAWGQDAVTSLAYLAGQTSRIRLGTGIMQISARTPSIGKRGSVSPAVSKKARGASAMTSSSRSQTSKMPGTYIAKP